ncbi:hypothetical protein C2E23DRAFT_859736 [Lenzites betulinus]|nr:hypothetical protein C2E23DRAFT_859736 [Lenzites betulinus]
MQPGSGCTVHVQPDQMGRLFNQPTALTPEICGSPIVDVPYSILTWGGWTDNATESDTSSIQESFLHDEQLATPYADSARLSAADTTTVTAYIEQHATETLESIYRFAVGVMGAPYWEGCAWSAWNDEWQSTHQENEAGEW